MKTGESRQCGQSGPNPITMKRKANPSLGTAPTHPAQTPGHEPQGRREILGGGLDHPERRNGERDGKQRPV
jgi:hypothetical protein